MNCPRCRAENPAGTSHCQHCGTILATAPATAEDSLVKVIPFHNPAALISYYLGIFSLIPILGALLGIIAIILGIFGLAAFHKDRRVRGAYHAYAGIALGTFVLLGHAAVVVYLWHHRISLRPF